MGEESSQGITRRDLLRRGAVLGGAVVWTTPVVQTLGMGRAFASTASPVETRISFIIMNVLCGTTTYFLRWETEDGFELGGANNNPHCQLSFEGQKVETQEELDSLGISVSIKPDGCATIDLGDCTLVEGKVYGGPPDPGHCKSFTESDLNNVCL